MEDKYFMRIRARAQRYVYTSPSRLYVYTSIYVHMCVYICARINFPLASLIIVLRLFSPFYEIIAVKGPRILSSIQQA